MQRRLPSSRAVASAPPAAEPAPTRPPGNGRTFVSPVVARIAAEHGVDPNAVTGTGTGGRVTKKDILAFIESGAAAPAAPERRLQPAPVAAPAARRGRTRRARAQPSSRRRRPGPPPRRARRLRPRRTAPGRRGRGADDGDAARRDGAHAPLARHLRPRHERDRGRHVADRRRPRDAQEGVPEPRTASTRRTSRSSPRRRSRRSRTTRGSTPRSAARRSSPAPGSTSGSPSRSTTARA